MPKGEMKTLEYNPGEAPVESLPADAGRYELTLKDKGKPGAKGWRKKSPKSFPNRMLRFVIHGTEDEVTGNEKSCVDFMSLSPGFPLQRIMFLAYGAGYPKKLKLQQGPKGKPNDPSVMHNMKQADELLQWIEDNEVVLRAELGVDTYNGRENNRIQKWLPPDEVVESADDEEAEVDEEMEETDAEETDESEETEETDETEEASEDEEASEESEEAEESEESDESEEALEDETEDEPPAKPIKPGKRVVQGPAKKGGKPAPKKKGKK